MIRRYINICNMRKEYPIMNKKIISVAAVLAAAAMLFAACGAEKDQTVSDTAASESVTSAVESESTEIVFEYDEEMDEEEEIDLDEYFPDVPDKDETSDSEASEEIADEASENPLQPMVDKALAESEWPMMAEVTDPVILKEFFTLDPENENYNEMIVMQCPISAVMSEIIIINANDTDSAKADLEARKTKAIETDAWYPRDQELAEASIVGVNGSYAYFIIGENAAAAETSINNYISENS